jgi:hypothetical protein
MHKPARKKREGGIEGFQIRVAHCREIGAGFKNKNACLVVNNPSAECIQTRESGRGEVGTITETNRVVTSGIAINAEGKSQDPL